MLILNIKSITIHCLLKDSLYRGIGKLYLLYTFLNDFNAQIYLDDIHLIWQDHHTESLRAPKRERTFGRLGITRHGGIKWNKPYQLTSWNIFLASVCGPLHHSQFPGGFCLVRISELLFKGTQGETVSCSLARNTLPVVFGNIWIL